MDQDALIEELMYKHRLRSDRAVGRFLGVSHTTIQKIRNGAGMTDELAGKLALGLGRDPGQFLIEMRAAHACDKQTKKMWTDLLTRVATVFGVALLLAEAGRSASQYILCKIDTAPKITA